MSHVRGSGDVVLCCERMKDGSHLYAAWYAGLDGCACQGDTADEARASLYETFPKYEAALLERGAVIPPPVPLSLTVQSMEWQS